MTIIPYFLSCTQEWTASAVCVLQAIEPLP